MAHLHLWLNEMGIDEMGLDEMGINQYFMDGSVTILIVLVSEKYEGMPIVLTSSPYPGITPIQL